MSTINNAENVENTENTEEVTAASDSNSEVENEQANGEAQNEETEKPVHTKTETARIVQERLAREQKKSAEWREKAEKYDALQAEGMSEAQRLVAEREAELRKEFAAKYVKRSIDAAAAGRFADVEDAHLRLAGRLDDFVVDGDVDDDAVKEAVDALLDSHPHLAAQRTPATPTPQQVGVGVSGSNPAPDVATEFSNWFGNMSA